MQEYIQFIQNQLFVPLADGLKKISSQHPRHTITRVYRHFANDSLYKNSIYLIASTGVMSVLGFFFWYINAKIFSAQDIGYATAIISISTLLSSFSIFGLDTGLLRFLPTSEYKNGKITASLITITGVSIILSLIYISNMHVLSPKLSFLYQQPLFSISFGIFVLITALNNITNGIFVAYRSSKYVLLTNSIFSVAKLIIPFFVISWGVIGIYAAVFGGVLVSLVISIGILVKQFSYRTTFAVDKTLFKKMYSFAFGSYLTTIIGGLPSQLLPIIIINKLRPEISAYFYIDMMIIGLLYIIPISATQSFFAESAFNEKHIQQNVTKAIRIMLLFLIPAITITCLCGKYFLLLFGKNYSTEGLLFLQIMAFSSIFAAGNYIFGSIFRMQGKLKEIGFVTAVGAIITLGISYGFVSYGLYTIALAMIIGQIGVVILYLLLSVINRAK